ncbi:hypothetical protein Lser_V15G41338 [Lactuca serriola]
MKILNRLIDMGLIFVDTLWSFSLSPCLYFAENHHPLSTGLHISLFLGKRHLNQREIKFYVLGIKRNFNSSKILLERALTKKMRTQGSAPKQPIVPSFLLPSESTYPDDTFNLFHFVWLYFILNI